MKYLKRYNEDIEWEFDDEEDEELDGIYYLFLYEYNDDYSIKINNDIRHHTFQNRYRIFIGLDSNHIIRDFNRNEIIFTDSIRYKKIHDPDLIKFIEKIDPYITNNYGTSYHGFKKWKFSELDSLLNINKKYLFIHNF